MQSGDKHLLAPHSERSLDTARKIDLFFVLFFLIFIWLCWVFIAVHRLSLAAESSGYSLVAVRASHCGGFSCGGAWAQ